MAVRVQSVPVLRRCVLRAKLHMDSIVIYKNNYFSVKYAASDDTSSFSNHETEGNDTIFGLRPGLQFSLLAFYSRGKEFARLCPHHVNCVTG